ncbi:putative charged multivesicular body protein 4b [Paratrimastix pyriformis]|uniref:Charged multivesicular body protein 4b n=1 Tax=Paratrimastix pyriformis TaxID=342808 RepID=A0ABQ8UWB9_9EUKA|nr:putative charged multivesicular body protein 4b [Paratrimastix pyriformis]|eukprot:GAFH01003945.1.p2 GENE.GAFH01003945.1~~GAFH01003945.1.p2  ORF type:complete len:242 (-),score=36.14 GAFH01003945.1:134-838(-)
MHFFGKAKKVDAPTAHESIQKLREAQEALEKRQNFLEKKAALEQDNARKLIAQKNRRGALMALKRKKIYEVQIEKLNNSCLTLEHQRFALENASLNNETLRAIKGGADAMKSINQGMTIEKVDETMEDVQEQMQIGSEIADAISQPLGIGAELDEDELNAELDALGEEDLQAQLAVPAGVPQAVPGQAVAAPAVATATATLPALPVPPTEAPRARAAPSREEEELRSLEAALGM